MIFSFAWKEIREHQAIWFTMVFMTVALGLGLGKVVAIGNRPLAITVTGLTIFGMAATYGVVCGAMMLAGEQEGGTQSFLDIFLGRRVLLWICKFGIGVVLVLTQAAVVALALRLLEQEPPSWVLPGARQARFRWGTNTWFFLLPIIVLQGFAWGLLGSSLTKRVLTAAAVGALGVIPVCLLALMGRPDVFITLQVVVGFVVLVVSFSAFLIPSQVGWTTSTPENERWLDPREKFLDIWDEFDEDVPTERRVHAASARVVVPLPASEPEAANGAATATATANETEDIPFPFEHSSEEEDENAQAESPGEVLWWLTTYQARPVLWALAVSAFVVGLIVHVNPQVLWPLATLAIGVACGVAAFAPEQRDLSYQFLAAQHLPLRAIWRFRVLFWGVAAVLLAGLIVVAHYLSLGAQGIWFKVDPQPPEGFPGTLRERLGSLLFFGIWLAHGFGVGQLVVWLCRKNVLALLVSSLISVVVLGLWLPSLLCGGMSGWPLWTAPLASLFATSLLVRAWAGGRIHEHRPRIALVGLGAGLLLWIAFFFGLRAVEVPDVGTPIDPVEFKASLQPVRDNAASRAIRVAAEQYTDENVRWSMTLANLARQPLGVIEPPRTDGQPQLMNHLLPCERMAANLAHRARGLEPEPAWEQIAIVLALSRNLRNKATLESYLAGIKVEETALGGLDEWLARGKPDALLLRRIRDELNRHALETPPPLDCLQSECFHSLGALANPSVWTLNMNPQGVQRSERWLAGSIALSLEAPWESERETRIWQMVWAGLFRGLQTPRWERPTQPDLPATEKVATRQILEAWIPDGAGGDGVADRARMTRLLDASWLSDERLFCSAARLRDAGTRARWRVDAARLALALGLFQLEHGQAPQDLQALVPNYFRDALPTDPYSGKAYGYRVSAGERIEGIGDVKAGQAVFWSTGPDGTNHDGKHQGANVPERDERWSKENLDLITVVP